MWDWTCLQAGASRDAGGRAASIRAMLWHGGQPRVRAAVHGVTQTRISLSMGRELYCAQSFLEYGSTVTSA